MNKLSRVFALVFYLSLSAFFLSTSSPIDIVPSFCLPVLLYYFHSCRLASVSLFAIIFIQTNAHTIRVRVTVELVPAVCVHVFCGGLVAITLPAVPRPSHEAESAGSANANSARCTAAQSTCELPQTLAPALALETAADASARCCCCCCCCCSARSSTAHGERIGCVCGGRGTLPASDAYRDRR